MAADSVQGVKGGDESIANAVKADTTSEPPKLGLSATGGSVAAPDITKELDELLSENPELQTLKAEAKSAETSTFRADAPVFVPQEFRANAPVFVPQCLRVRPTLSDIPDISVADGLGKIPLSPPPQYMAPTSYAATEPPLSPFGGVASVSDSTGGVRLFEDRWGAEAVPDALKELWIPPCLPPQSRVLATVPPKSPVQYAQAPPLYPFEAPSVHHSDSLKSWVTPSTVAPDSPPLVATPTSYNVPMPLPQLLLPPPGPFELPPPPPPPLPDYVFSMRELLLKFRTSMGRVPAPWDLQLRYSIVDEKELALGSPTGSAGATLLKFVKGQASESEVLGKAKGAELMQMLQTSSGDEPQNDNLARLLGISPQKRQLQDEAPKNGTGSWKSGATLRDGDWRTKPQNWYDRSPNQTNSRRWNSGSHNWYRH